ncbi:DUF401 family protein [Desulfatibacillum aliphaticivorans]|uniref:DUF401 family protein n=1 Tax=Desulfatibacillum aliphaticivorans TaxID=218208 RepID=UPI0024A9FAE1|nr:DUF401 family protein [Desulfatibacillum aliphaticivorans]
MLVVFILIVVLIYRKVSLGTSLVSGAVALGLWSLMSPLEILVSFAHTMVLPKTILLAAVVSLILILSHLMESTGQMKRLVSSFEGISNNVRINLTVFPALIGLLPMPGGAVFSAPMVEAMSKEHDISQADKALINYWFRHIWEYCWPLYPGVILAVSLSGLSLSEYFLAMGPMTLLAVAAGYLIILSPLNVLRKPKEEKGSWRALINEMSPILIVVIGAGVFGEGFALAARQGVLPRLPPEIPLCLSLTAGILWILIRHKTGLDPVIQLFKKPSLWSMVYLVIGVMLFAGILESSHSVQQISQSLADGHVPVALVAVILPLIVGALTGICMAFVGATFPILYALLEASGLSHQIVAYTILAYCSGYAGLLASPIHACLALTQSYFCADMPSIYRKLWILVAIEFTGGLVGFFLALHLIG